MSWGPAMTVNPQSVGHHFVGAINNHNPINIAPTRSGKRDVNSIEFNYFEKL